MTIENSAGEGSSANSTFIGLQSNKSMHRLSQITKVKARGVSDNIDLPQLVVCGDQSAGKSSVLEGITNLPFPRSDGVCTKFATEIVLHDDPSPITVTATIIPNQSRSREEAQMLRKFSRKLNGDLKELPDIIKESAALMGIKGFGGRTEGPAFGNDVLRIEVLGQIGLRLTVVDLPGLIAVANEEQTEDDVRMVGQLVDKYLRNPRTIILAVVQATNDIANQGIIQRARGFDGAGERTVGIITKADMINPGTEARIALLAKNQDTTKLKLGFFLVRNPTPKELADKITPQQRQEEEMKLFRSRKWSRHNLDESRVGILALREYMQELLDQHIEKELPKVIEDIRREKAKVEERLQGLGDRRPTPGHIRMFLTKLSVEFANITKAALDGTYHEADPLFFGKDGNDNYMHRLRALVHSLNGIFAKYMRDKAQKIKVHNVRPRRVQEDDDDEEYESEEEGEIKEDAADVEEAEEKEEDQQAQSLEDHLEPFRGERLQKDVTQAEFDAWVKKAYQNNRGKELPGNTNHILLSELYHEQSSLWDGIALKHVDHVYKQTLHFVLSVLKHVVKEEAVRQKIRGIVTASFEMRLAAAHEELNRLKKDEERQPITYNHYYTDNIQKERGNSPEQIRLAVQALTLPNGQTVHPETLTKMLQRTLITDMDEQACAEVKAGLSAYYKVAMKTYVDNVCRQVIERHVLSDLPEVFSTTQIANYDDEELKRLAAEPQRIIDERTRLQSLLEGLNESLNDLRS
ncbi:MAG: hypothetical protein M1825_000432 [Sarcosagium campestre]|nr:MAG: hypothetical protein M1825_000432 [Sarcosagium campestre]